MTSAVGLALRSLFWTILCPGSIAGLIPWFVLGLSSAHYARNNPLDRLATILMVIGALTLGNCILEFAMSGKATLSPLDAPKRLVVEGLYRHVRNPMYVGVATLLLGETLLLRTWPMLWYALAVFVGFNVFIKAYEEPTLLRMFGDQFRLYKSNVPMWLPRRKPWKGGDDFADAAEGDS